MSNPDFPSNAELIHRVATAINAENGTQTKATLLVASVNLAALIGQIADHRPVLSASIAAGALQVLLDILTAQEADKFLDGQDVMQPVVQAYLNDMPSREDLAAEGANSAPDGTLN